MHRGKKTTQEYRTHTDNLKKIIYLATAQMITSHDAKNDSLELLKI